MGEAISRLPFQRPSVEENAVGAMMHVAGGSGGA